MNSNLVHAGVGGVGAGGNLDFSPLPVGRHLLRQLLAPEISEDQDLQVHLDPSIA